METFYSWFIGRTGKTTPVDADTLPLSDSVADSHIDFLDRRDDEPRSV